MNLPSFEEFEKQVKIKGLEETYNKLDFNTELPLNEGNANDLLSKATKNSIAIMNRLLKSYHEWLASLLAEE